MSRLAHLLKRFSVMPDAALCSTPEGAYANCYAMSVGFAQFLRAHGQPCRLLQARGALLDVGAGAGRWPHTDPAGFEHWTVAVGNLSVDWTARQFDAGAAWPQVIPVAALQLDWVQVSEWACESCGSLCADPRHADLAPEHMHADHALAAFMSADGPFADPRHLDTLPLQSPCGEGCSPAAVGDDDGEPELLGAIL